MKLNSILIVVLALISLTLPACNMHKEEEHHEAHKILATSPQCKPVTLTQRYVCQIHSQRHIAVKALEEGYLESIPVSEGQHVKKGDLLFSVRPVLYKAKADAENAMAELAELQVEFTKKLRDDRVVHDNQVRLRQAEYDKAKANAALAMAELDFAYVKAPFDGIIDCQHHQQGSLVDKGEVLTTLSDNSVMWVYFYVPERDYLEYMASDGQQKKDLKIELELANGEKFEHLCSNLVIEADFNNQNGTVGFRADFPNPDHLLRHGQTGNVSISRVQKDAIVIPQRATFEVLQKRYVYVVDKDNVAHQREINVQNEQEDIFILKDGLSPDEKIVLEGIRQVRDGEEVECEDRASEQVAANLKNHAE